MQSQNQLSYKDVQAKFLKTIAYPSASLATVMKNFNIGPELEKLSANGVFTVISMFAKTVVIISFNPHVSVAVTTCSNNK